MEQMAEVNKVLKLELQINKTEELEHKCLKIEEK